MRKCISTLALLAIATTTAQAAILTFEPSTGSFARVSVGLTAKSPSLAASGFWLQTVDDFSGDIEGFAVQDGWRLAMKGIRSTIEVKGSASSTEGFWTGEQFEPFTLSWSVNEHIRIVVDDYEETILPRRPGDDVGTIPGGGVYPTYSVDGIRFSWELTGPRSSVSGEHVTQYSRTGGMGMSLQPDAFPTLTASLGRVTDPTAVWSGELDGAQFDIEAFSSMFGLLVPEPSSATLMLMGLVAIGGRVRRCKP